MFFGYGFQRNYNFVYSVDTTLCNNGIDLVKSMIIGYDLPTKEGMEDYNTYMPKIN
jgi:hypothetical protein